MNTNRTTASILSSDLLEWQGKLPPLLTNEEVAEIARVHTSTIDRWVAEGLFPAPVKLGGAIKRHLRDAVLKFIADQRSELPMSSRRRKTQRGDV